jgi:uncharacterized protein (DUF885 family)
MADIFELSDTATDRVAAAEPSLATYQGIAGHDHEWPDLSPEGTAATRQLYVELRAAATGCDIPDDRHLLAQRVLVEHCDVAISFHDSGGHEVAMNNIACAHQELRFIYGSMGHETSDDWEAIIQRVSTVGAALDGYRQTLDDGRRSGNVVAGRQVEVVME